MYYIVYQFVDVNISTRDAKRTVRARLNIGAFLVMDEHQSAHL